MCDTNLDDGIFDAIIDKALLDSLLCGEQSYVQQYISEVSAFKCIIT